MIALDTHVWVFLVTGDLKRIPARTINKIKNSDKLYLCAISCWEVALLEKKGRLKLSMPADVWIFNALKFPQLEVIDLTPQLLVESVKIEKFHPDPADRMITAMCLLNGYTLVTKDKKIQHSGTIKTIW